MSESRAVLDKAVAYLAERGAPRTADNLNRAMLAIRGIDTGDDPYSVDLTGNGPTETISPRGTPQAAARPTPRTNAQPAAPPTASTTPTAAVNPATVPPALQGEIPLPNPTVTDSGVASTTASPSSLPLDERLAAPVLPPNLEAPAEPPPPSTKPEGTKLIFDENGIPQLYDPSTFTPFRNQGNTKPQQVSIDSEARARADAEARGVSPYTDAREQTFAYQPLMSPEEQAQLHSGAARNTISPLDFIGGASAAGSNLAAWGRQVPGLVGSLARSMRTEPVPPPPVQAVRPGPTREAAARVASGRGRGIPVDIPPGPVPVPGVTAVRPPNINPTPGRPVAPGIPPETSTQAQLQQLLTQRAPPPNTPVHMPPRPVGSAPSNVGAPRVVDQGNPTAVGQMPMAPANVPAVTPRPGPGYTPNAGGSTAPATPPGRNVPIQRTAPPSPRSGPAEVTPGAPGTPNTTPAPTSSVSSAQSEVVRRLTAMFRQRGMSAAEAQDAAIAEVARRGSRS